MSFRFWVMKTNGRGFVPKYKFDAHEDLLLLEAVNRLGTSDWCAISAAVPGRNARQCRERWTNYVNPALVSGTWTEADDELLMRKYNELGAKWHVITSFFDRRSKNSIKNRFFALRRRQEARRANSGPPSHPGDRPLRIPLRDSKSAVQTPPAKEATPPDVEEEMRTEDPLAFLDQLQESYPFLWSSQIEDVPDSFLKNTF
jgi:hypothetical protein